MDLGLDIESLTHRGRKAAPLEVYDFRVAEERDVRALDAPAPGAMEIKRISERHHALARALASGMSEAEAAAHVGYVGSRVSVLKASPAFQELLSLYRTKIDSEFAEIGARLAGITKDALSLLQDRLEDEPEKVSTGQLMELAKLGADRSGFGPSAKTEINVNVELGRRLKEARARALAPRDITPEDE
jgi:hypothetical protein